MTGIKNRLCPPKNAYKKLLCPYDKINLCRHNFQGFKVLNVSSGTKERVENLFILDYYLKYHHSIKNLCFYKKLT